MNLKQIIQRIKRLSPTKEEILSSYSNEVDTDYVEYVLESFNVHVTNSNSNEQYILERLIYSTNIQKVDFGGVTFVSALEPFNIKNSKNEFLQFASFQENILATSLDFSTFYYIDLYDPNSEPIVVKERFDETQFLEALLYLLQLDVNYRYRGLPVQTEEVLKLSSMAGFEGYKKFFHIVFGQYN